MQRSVEVSCHPITCHSLEARSALARLYEFRRHVALLLLERYGIIKLSHLSEFNLWQFVIVIPGPDFCDAGSYVFGCRYFDALSVPVYLTSVYGTARMCCHLHPPLEDASLCIVESWCFSVATWWRDETCGESNRLILAREV